MSAPQGSWSTFFLSFEGRVTRKQFWLFYVLLLLVPTSLVSAAIDIALGYGDKNGPGDLVFLLVIWPALAIVIKRWHDRNKSGWWILIALIPIIGIIWVMVENGFLRGTPGANRFGADPLASAT